MAKKEIIVPNGKEKRAVPGKNPIAAVAEKFAKQKSGDAAEKNEKTRALFAAAKKGKWGTVMSEVNKDNINERDVRGMTLLMVAAEQGEYTLVHRLVRNGAHKNAIDDYERSALTHALLNGHSKVAKLIQDMDTNWKFDLYVAVRDRRKMLVMTMKEVLGATGEDIAAAEEKAKDEPERGLSRKTRRVSSTGMDVHELEIMFQSTGDTEKRVAEKKPEETKGKSKGAKGGPDYNPGTLGC